MTWPITKSRITMIIMQITQMATPMATMIKIMVRPPPRARGSWVRLLWNATADVAIEFMNEHGGALKLDEIVGRHQRRHGAVAYGAGVAQPWQR
jgi:hypothetical protein